MTKRPKKQEAGNTLASDLFHSPKSPALSPEQVAMGLTLDMTSEDISEPHLQSLHSPVRVLDALQSGLKKFDRTWVEVKRDCKVAASEDATHLKSAVFGIAEKLQRRVLASVGF